MRLKKPAAALCVMMSVAACTSSSGVMKLAPETYRTSARASSVAGGSPEAQKMALDQAHQYCEQQNLEILVDDISVQTTSLNANANITFRCLAKGDPELVRPTYRAAPTL